jgi:hypothetical protein
LCNSVLGEHPFDRRGGQVRIGKELLAVCADELSTGSTRQRHHLVVDVRDDALRIGHHEGIDARLDERVGVELLVAQHLVELGLYRLYLMFCRVVGADQEIPDDAFVDVAQAVTETMAGKWLPSFLV